MCDKKNTWQKYWSETNAFTSLASDFNLNYEGEIFSHWSNIFQSLNRNAKVLDIACGNMPISIIALEVSDKYNLDLSVSASDVVTINVNKIHSEIGVNKQILDRVNVYSDMNSEKLNFKDKKYNLVTSMFGFEYSDPELTLMSIKNVLTSTGRAEFVCHYSNSRIIEVNTAIYNSLKELLSSTGILQVVQKLSNSMGYIKTKEQLKQLKYNNKSENLREKLNTKLLGYYERYGVHAKDTNLIEFIKHFFSNLLGSSKNTRNQLIKTYKYELFNHLIRLEDLLSSSLSENKLTQIRELSAKLGFDFKPPKILKHKNHNVGMALSLVKN